MRIRNSNTPSGKQGKLDKSRNQSVVKANSLIQKSRYNLSAVEQKIILYLITKIRPDDQELTTYNFQITEFCDVCGIDSKGGRLYADLKATIKRLADKSIWIHLEDGVETLLRWIEKPYIYSQKGVIKVKIDEDMRPYLLQLQSHFTKYDLYYILAMKSQYSIRMYELLKSYENLGTFTVDLNDLKRALSAEKYGRWPDFRRYVLDKSVSEINTYSDITVVYQIVKDGRRFARLQFGISLKTDINERMRTWANIEQHLNPKQVKGQVSLYTPDISDK